MRRLPDRVTRPDASITCGRAIGGDIMYITMYIEVDMAEPSVSIAEARAKLSGLVKKAEEGATVRITRWGTPVAVLVSATRYHQLAQGRPSFGAALDDYLEGVEIAGIGLEKGELEDLRDRETGREPRW